MKIGVDLRVLQIGHQYRGIGEVVKRTLNEIFVLATKEQSPPQFIFYEYDDDPVDPKEFLTLPSGLNFTVVNVGPRPLLKPDRSSGQKLTDKWRQLFGNPLPEARQCNVFLQFDYALGVPRRPRTVLIKHDIIPYIFWNDYFTSPWLHVKHKAARTTLRTILANYEYKRTLKRSVRRAWKIVCVSEHTRQDLHRLLHVSLKKMKTIPLGVSEVMLPSKSKVQTELLPTKPYILFIGAVDMRRRRVDDIVAAFNNLKAQGTDIQLVLAGENFQKPTGIPNKVVREAVMMSSYSDDILTLGYIDDATKYKLFKEAIAFVFPTIYEGFGIPILEAMLMNCPVIAYKNSSIPEVGGKHALYAKDWQDIQNRIKEVMSMTTEQRQEFIAAAAKHARTFSWQKTAAAIYQQVLGNE